MPCHIRYTIAIAALVLAAAAPASAQDGALAPIDRELAWGAWNAGRDHDVAATAWLVQIVDARIDDTPWSAPVDFALDALIQLDARLEPELLGRIAKERPVEALVLLAREPDGRADGVLLEVLERERGYRWLAAANLLLRRSPAGFAARLLADLRIHVTLIVTDDEDSSFACGGIAAGIGCGVLTDAPGMPPWPTYRLTDGEDTDDDARLLADGPKRVACLRVVAPAGAGPRRGGSDVETTAADRLRYLAALAGPQPLLEAGESRTIRWVPNLDLQPVQTDLRRDITERHAALVRDLVVTGYLTAEEAAGLTVQVDIEVVDRHEP
jgi:hypothetical protein